MHCCWERRMVKPFRGRAIWQYVNCIHVTVDTGSTLPRSLLKGQLQFYEYTHAHGYFHIVAEY